MYLKIVCLNELNRNYFYLLPLHLLLLPINKNYFSDIVGFCVYIINTITHGCLKIWNFSSRVQFDISLYRVEHSKRNSISPRAHVLLSI